MGMDYVTLVAITCITKPLHVFIQVNATLLRWGPTRSSLLSPDGAVIYDKDDKYGFIVVPVIAPA